MSFLYHSRTALSVLLTCCPPAPPAHPFPLDVLVADLDLCLVGFGQYGNRGGGCVDATLGFGGGNSLHAVSAALVAEMTKRIVALDAEGDLLESARLAGAKVDHLDLPAAIPGVMAVHLEEVAGEESSLVAAGSGANFHDQALEVLAAREQEFLQPHGQRFAAFAQRGGFPLGVKPHLRLLVSEHLLGQGEIRLDLLVFEIRFDLTRQGTVLLGDCRVAAAIAGHHGIRELLLQVAVAREHLFEYGPHERRFLPGMIVAERCRSTRVVDPAQVSNCS